KVYYAVGAMELKKYELAEAELKKAMILAGNDSQMKLQILSMMGDLKYRMRDFEGAFKYLEEALIIDPNDVLLLNNYAYFLAENGSELQKALKMIMRVIEVEGKNPTYLDTYAWVLYKTGKNEEAYGIMKEIIETEKGKDSEILEHMGYILKALSKCEEAMKFWRKALEADGSRQYLIREIELCEEANKE
ncbi:MAG: tetratricopeptide repeat protein, partial [Bacteroidales bacterium]|nr:tetratricopeptide repeat protein [Bacteroidales bacterium]